MEYEKNHSFLLYLLYTEVSPVWEESNVLELMTDALGQS